MFSKAYTLATQFTRPVIISKLTRGKRVEAGIGSFVILNNLGWIATAFHIVRMTFDLASEVRANQDYDQKCKDIDDDPTIQKKDKNRHKHRLPSPPENSAVKSSVHWAFNGSNISKFYYIEAADLAIGRLQPFDPSWVSAYPKIKDPNRNFGPGTSLCRFGFPFEEVKPVYHEDRNLFELPAKVPFFPNEGIFTRFIDIETDLAYPRPSYPLQYVETSSPGLKGQSGGPITDHEGAIWGIQSQTNHYSLGFDAKININGKIRTTENEFFHVGWGVSAATLTGFLLEKGISFEYTDY